MNKRIFAILIAAVIICMGFSVTTFANDSNGFETPPISLDGNKKTPSPRGDGFTTPMIDGDDSSTSSKSSTTSQNSGSTTNNNSSTSSASTTGKTDAAVEGTQIKKLIPARRVLTVKWNKKLTVDGYQIQLATDKNFSKNKKLVTVKKKTTVKKKIKKLKAKKYFVRVRTYKLVNGEKVYSPWSAVKVAKVK